MPLLASIAQDIVPCGTTYLEAYKKYHNDYIKTILKEKPEQREKQRIYSRKRREAMKASKQEDVNTTSTEQE